jgi:hypothetical protein
MKSKELIAYLQEVDPTGETEVFIEGAVDFFKPYTTEMYWDGCAFKMNPKYDSYPESFTVLSEGKKIVLESFSFEDALIDNPEFPIEYDSKYSEDKWSNRIFRERLEYRAIDEEVERKLNEKT